MVTKNQDVLSLPPLQAEVAHCQEVRGGHVRVEELKCVQRGVDAVRGHQGYEGLQGQVQRC